MFDHRYKFVFPGLLAVYSFLNIQLLDGDRLFQAEIESSKLFYLIFFLCYAVWLANWLIEKYALKKFEKHHPLLIQFGCSLVAVSLISLISVYATGLFFGDPYSYSMTNLLLTSGFSFRINLFLNSINAIYFFSKKLKEKAVEAERLQTLNMSAKLESLNSQINPHFFFNNLSALSALIHEDVKLADAYLQKLSTIYRYILNNKDKELVSLREELNFLKNYVALLSIRFQESLSFKIEVDESCTNLLLPPAVLQLLVENVVKHNYFTISEPIEVLIHADCDYIIIRNKKQLKDAVDFSTGIGLQNISDRYRFLGSEINVMNAEGYFEVKLPLIKTYENRNHRRRATSP
jgi:two-component system LytT family sensor kinase